MAVKHDTLSITTVKHGTITTTGVRHDTIPVTDRKISFSGTNCNWSSTSNKIAYDGDYILISSTTVTCKIGGSSGSTRWTNTVSKKDDTYQYSYGTPSISTTSFTVSANATISASATRTQNDVIIFKFNPAYGHGGWWEDGDGEEVKYEYYVNGTHLSIANKAVYLNGPITQTYYPNVATDDYVIGNVTASKTGTLSTGNGNITVTAGVVQAAIAEPK